MRIDQLVLWNSPTGLSLKDEEVWIRDKQLDKFLIESEADPSDEEPFFYYWVDSSELKPISE